MGKTGSGFRQSILLVLITVVYRFMIPVLKEGT